MMGIYTDIFDASNSNEIVRTVNSWSLAKMSLTPYSIGISDSQVDRNESRLR